MQCGERALLETKLAEAVHTSLESLNYRDSPGQYSAIEWKELGRKSEQAARTERAARIAVETHKRMCPLCRERNPYTSLREKEDVTKRQ